MTTFGKIAILLAGTAALAACNPDGSRNRAVTGGILGGMAGATTGSPVAASIGASAGMGIGANLDRQRAQLQADLGSSGATVVNTGNTLVITLPESITFDTGSTIIHPDYVDEIALIARSLRQNPDSTLVVIGHTDNVGSTAYNQALSERRAAAVAQILTSNGVAPTRVTTVGRGYSQPIASNETPGGRAQNRRVEIIITPTAG